MNKEPRLYTSSLLTRVLAVILALMVAGLIVVFRYFGPAEMQTENWLSVFVALVLGLLTFMFTINLVIRFKVRFLLDEDSLVDLHTGVKILLNEIEAIHYYRPYRSFYAVYQVKDRQGTVISFVSNTLLNGRPFGERLISALVKITSLEPQKGELLKPSNKPRERLIALGLGAAVTLFMLSSPGEVSLDGFKPAPKGAYSMIKTEIDYEVGGGEFKLRRNNIAVSARMRRQLADSYEIDLVPNESLTMNLFILPRPAEFFDFKITAREGLEYICLAKGWKILHIGLLKKGATLVRCPARVQQQVLYLVIAAPGAAKRHGWVGKPFNLTRGQVNYHHLALDNDEYERRESRD